MSKDIRCDICDNKISYWEHHFKTPKIEVKDGGPARYDICSTCWGLLSETIKYLRKTGEVEVKLGVFRMIAREDARREAYAQAMGWKK
jgi:hypothetical protein